MTFSPVKWTFKSDTYQVIEREKLFLADQDETINEDLKDLSEEMQDRARRELADSNEAYVMVVQFKEECVQRRYVYLYFSYFRRISR